jgi:hypothetical protein
MKRATLLFPLACAACGGGQEPPKTDNDVPKTPEASTAPKLNVQSEFGVVDERAVAKIVSSIMPQLQRCQTQSLTRIEFLSGDFRFYLRLGADGRVKWSYLEDSSLGDRETEKCILDVLGAQQWPKPEGGPQAEVRSSSSFGFDPPPNARQPSFWPSDKISATLGKHAKDIEKCTSGVSAKFTVTAYVEPAGKEGKVLAVGVATTSQEGADKIDCLVDVIKKMKMPSPGSWAAKVTFQL